MNTALQSTCDKHMTLSFEVIAPVAAVQGKFYCKSHPE